MTVWVCLVRVMASKRRWFEDWGNRGSGLSGMDVHDDADDVAYDEVEGSAGYMDLVKLNATRHK